MRETRFVRHLEDEVKAKNWWVLCWAVLLFFSAQTKAAENSNRYVGSFQHSVPKYHYTGDRVDFTLSGAKLKGRYHGIENFGDHGAGYYVADVENLQITEGKISFSISARHVMSEPPGNGKAATERTFETDLVIFEGTLKGDVLTLNCSSKDDYACFDKVMEFTRLK